MKTWEMDIKAVTHIKVQAETIEDALKDVEKNFYTLSYNNKIRWDNFAIIRSSIGVSENEKKNTN